MTIAGSIVAAGQGRFKRRWRAVLAIALVGCAGLGTPAIAKPTATEVAVAKALAARLPKTRITTVRCDGLGGLCEVAAGTTLFYTDHAARFMVIGRVYDMKTRSDLTAARLLEINPDLLVNGAPRREEAADAGAPRPASAATVSLQGLPANGAIDWGPIAGPKVVVFSDFRCPYCARLSQTLRALGARVEERPISVLGTRAISEAVLCAPSPEAALHAAYAGNPPAPRAVGDSQTAKPCDTSGLDANEAFAKRSGFGGTPVLVRADGAVIEGFRPAEVLAAWLKADTSSARAGR